MAQIFGEIGAFKELRRILFAVGINELNTFNELTAFQANYEFNKLEAERKAEEKVFAQIRDLKSSLEQYRKDYKTTKEVRDDILEDKTKSINQRILKIQSRILHSWFDLAGKTFLLMVLTIRKSNLEMRVQRSFRRKLSEIEVKGKRVSKELDYCIDNKSELIKKEKEIIVGRLEHIHATIQNNHIFYTGALGEYQVEQELKKLSDDYIVFNDYQMSFHPPLFNNKYPKGIYHVQIDHLVISKSGIFIIETKNWSKQTVASLDLRSPVGQIERAGYALFIKIQDGVKKQFLQLEGHHWGTKRIPVKNLLVLIKNRPKEEFENVRVLTLDRLNGYLSHCRQIFEDPEVRNITAYLERLRDK